MLRFLQIFLVGLLFSTQVVAGPVFISSMDVDDHGSATASANLDGWLLLQRIFEGVAVKVKNGNKRVVCIGCNSANAINAFVSSFDKSALPAAGWTRHLLTGSGEIASFLNNTHPNLTLATTGFVYMASDRINVIGGLTENQLVAINNNASGINKYLKSGGGLVSNTQSGLAGGYGWLKSAIDGLTVSDAGVGDYPLTLMSSSAAAFPGITPALFGSANHGHNYFSGNFAGLNVLATGLLNDPLSLDAASSEQTKAQLSAAFILGGADVNFDSTSESIPVMPSEMMIAMVVALTAMFTLTLRRRLKHSVVQHARRRPF